MLQNVKTRSNVEATLIRKAWSDGEFKSKLMADPTATYRAEAEGVGASLPAATQVRAIEEDKNTLYLVIPNVEVEAGTEVKLTERSTRADFEASLILRAMRDAEFKGALLADPKAAYEAQLGAVHQGAKLPGDLTVKAVEESDSVVYFRLPQAPPQGGEMSEQDLEQVAGGVVAVGVAIASTVAVGLVAVAVLLATEEQLQKTAE